MCGVCGAVFVHAHLTEGPVVLVVLSSEKAAMSGARAVASAPLWATLTLVGTGPVTKKVPHEPLSKSLTAQNGRLIQEFNVATRGKPSYNVLQCRSLYDAYVKPSASREV